MPPMSMLSFHHMHQHKQPLHWGDWQSLSWTHFLSLCQKPWFVLLKKFSFYFWVFVLQTFIKTHHHNLIGNEFVKKYISLIQWNYATANIYIKSFLLMWLKELLMLTNANYTVVTRAMLHLSLETTWRYITYCQLDWD